MKTFAQISAIMSAIVALNCSCDADNSSAPEVAGPPPGAPPATAPLPGTLAGKIVFSRAADGTNTLLLMNADGSGQMSLGVKGFKPAVSPDGRKIVYSTPNNAIAVLDLTTAKDLIVDNQFSAAPKWSRDGSKILFWSNRSGTKEFWTMNADGSGAARLTDGGDGYHEGDMSPDGARIVLRRVLPGSGGGDLWMMNADGTNARLFYAGDRMDTDPHWSPDGKRIAFVRIVPKEPSGTTSEIFVIDADGSNLRQLTHEAPDAWAPRWSPAGSEIVFFSFRNGPDDPDLFTVRPDGTGLRVLVGGSTYDHGAFYGPR